MQTFSVNEPPVSLIDQYYSNLSRFWLPVAPVDQVGHAKPLAVELLGQEIVLVKLDGQIAALSGLCRHFQARLADGTIDAACRRYGGQVLRCPYHGWAYNGAGACVDIPQLSADRSIPPAARIESFPVQEKYGLVWVCLKGPAQFDMPEFSECSAPDMVWTRLQYSEPWASSLFRMVQSALDDYHFPWLHEGVLGTRNRPEPPVRQITRTQSALVSQFSVEQPANITNSVSAAAALSQVSYSMIVDMPNVIRLIKTNSAGVYVVMFFPVPHAFNRTGIFWAVARNYDSGPGGDERVLAMERFIQSQDRAHVSGQRMWAMAPFPIRGADDAIVEYLGWLDRLGLPSNL
jgi:phenylpropionate dioxygenase-like ring-hydroxylating dioxygenase large terminal subunit